MGIDFEATDAGQDMIQDIPQIADLPQIAQETPPRLERVESGEAGEMPPKLERVETLGMTLGESVEVHSARSHLNNMIKSGNKIAIKNAEQRLAETLAKEAQKELERKQKNS